MLEELKRVQMEEEAKKKKEWEECNAFVQIEEKQHAGQTEQILQQKNVASTNEQPVVMQLQNDPTLANATNPAQEHVDAKFNIVIYILKCYFIRLKVMRRKRQRRSKRSVKNCLHFKNQLERP